MLNIDSVFFFIFIFTILVTLKNVTKFVGALLQKTPEPVVYSNRELINIGLSLSYIITYIVFK